MTKIADLHCHPSLKPTFNEDIDNLWVEKKNITTRALFRGGGLSDKLRKLAIDMFLKNMARYTQSNLEACMEGNNKLVFFAIYPPERPFMKPDRLFNNVTTGIQKKLLKGIFANLGIDSKIIRALTGFSKKEVDGFLQDIYHAAEIDYFKGLMREYTKIRDEHDKPYTLAGYSRPVKLKLINDFSEVGALSNWEIAGIITLEGAHVLANYNKNDLFNARNIDALDAGPRRDLEESFKENIKKVKLLEFPPFFITFSHHFNNLVSGHAKSFKDAKNFLIPGFSNVFDQRNGLDDGFTDFGKTLITDFLLSKDYFDRRILIDTKHMSLKCRDEFTALVKAHPDNIPVICSHTAVNGISTRAESANRADTNKLDQRSYVSRWDINLTNEDITDIFDTDGIIGICMHDGRMPGGKFNKLVKVENRAMGSTIRVQRLHTQMFLTNIFHVVRVTLDHIKKLNAQTGAGIDHKEAWKTAGLGTDFDGIIDPFDHFNTSASLTEFKGRCRDAIDYNFADNMERKKARVLFIWEDFSRPYTKTQFNELLMGFSPEELVDMIFYDNIANFCKKYFTATYLNKTTNP